MTENVSRVDAVEVKSEYAGVTGYSGLPRFDHAAFWDRAQEWAEAGVAVFVSEYSAPSGWVQLWEKPLRSTIRPGSEERHIVIEQLFTYAPAAPEVPA